MLSEQLKNDIRQGFENLKSQMPGFVARPSQKLMIARIAQVLSEQDANKFSIGVVEGPTGTGKTMGYLLSAIPVARALKKILVISTGTISLQEQLVTKDLPAVARYSGYSFNVALAKGRGRYLCQTRLSRLAAVDQKVINPSATQSDLFKDLEKDDELSQYFTPPNASDLKLYQRLQKAYNKGEWDGDRDHWPHEINTHIWQPITNDHLGCLGRNCPAAESCCYLKARKRLFAVDIIVANHDLVLADLALGGGVVLPDTKEAIYVFDEGHLLPDKAISHLGAKASINGSVRTLERFDILASKALGLVGEKGQYHAFMQSLPARLELAKNNLQQLHRMLASLPPFKNLSVTEEALDNIIHRFEMGLIPDEFIAPLKNLQVTFSQLHRGINTLHTGIIKAIKEGTLTGQQCDSLNTALAIASGQLQQQLQTWQGLTTQAEQGSPPLAKWIKVVAGKELLDFVIEVSPISAAEALYEQLWSKCAGAILTSATLTALNSFDRFQHKTGLPDPPQALYLQLSSPFNYQVQGTIIIPENLPEPGDFINHSQAIVYHLNTLVKAGKGILALFSSRKQMDKVYQGLSDHCQPYVLMQGSLSRKALLQAHRKAIKQGQPSILFGLDSLANGLDLPGDLCTHVVIAKIPFTVPDAPIEAAQSEWLLSLKRNPFKELSLPEASVKLTQAVGRLIRVETDRGVVTIMDSRLKSKWYGKALVKALPPFPIS